MSDEPLKPMFYIRSYKHDRHDAHTQDALWWRAGSSGYTYDLREAGLYTRAEADEICDPGNSMLGAANELIPNNIAIPQAMVWSLVGYRVNRFDLANAMAKSTTNGGGTRLLHAEDQQ